MVIWGGEGRSLDARSAEKEENHFKFLYSISCSSDTIIRKTKLSKPKKTKPKVKGKKKPSPFSKFEFDRLVALVIAQSEDTQEQGQEKAAYRILLFFSVPSG